MAAAIERHGTRFKPDDVLWTLVPPNIVGEKDDEKSVRIALKMGAIIGKVITTAPNGFPVPTFVPEKSFYGQLFVPTPEQVQEMHASRVIILNEPKHTHVQPPLVNVRDIGVAHQYMTVVLDKLFVLHCTPSYICAVDICVPGQQRAIGQVVKILKTDGDMAPRTILEGAVCTVHIAKDGSILMSMLRVSTTRVATAEDIKWMDERAENIENQRALVGINSAHIYHRPTNSMRLFDKATKTVFTCSSNHQQDGLPMIGDVCSKCHEVITPHTTAMLFPAKPGGAKHVMHDTLIESLVKKDMNSHDSLSQGALVKACREALSKNRFALIQKRPCKHLKNGKAIANYTIVGLL